MIKGPFCQISTTPSPLPQGLRDPPSYSASSSSKPPTSNPPAYDDELPAYSSIDKPSSKSFEKQSPADDTLHFLSHPHDTLPSLSLRYNVPIPILRSTNNLTSDHLLLARRTLLIPSSHYNGASLSPRPVEGEEEEHRKGVIRKWMVRCKVAEYDVAVLYLEGAGYDLEKAVERWGEDERWEREHPLIGGKGKGHGRDGGRRRFTGLKG